MVKSKKALKVIESEPLPILERTQSLAINEPETEPESEPEPIKPKRIMSQAQLDNLVKAREAARIKKAEISQNNAKAKALKEEENKLKAIQYDNIKQQQQQELNKVVVETPKQKTKKIIKKVVEVEESESEEEEEEVIVVKKSKPKKQQQEPNYNQLLYENSVDKIREKLLDDRARTLINALTPSYH